MHISDDDLRRLSGLESADAIAWLRHRQPASGDGGGRWWEEVVIRILQLVYRAKDESTRHEFARLAAATTVEAVDGATLGEREGAIRLANLAAFCVQFEGAHDNLFDINSIVAHCLDLIEIPVGLAADWARSWKELPIEKIRVLRNAKNLITPCALIQERVTDRDLAERLSEWVHLRERLP